MGTSQFNPANAGRADFTNLFEELAKARGGCADLDARLDMYEAAISQINTDMEINIEPDISTLKASLRHLLDTGAKNMTQYETAGGIRYCDIPVDLEAGTYHMYFGDLDSTDTDGTKCLLEGFLYSQGHDVVITPTTTPVLMNRGEGSNIEFIVNSKTDRLRIWAGEDKDASLEDDVSFADAMVCLQSDYELSPTFVTFVPTLAALYQRVLDVELEILAARGGKSSLDGRFDATDNAIADESTARQAADDVLTAGIAGQIDGGAKNLILDKRTPTTETIKGITVVHDAAAGTVTISGTHDGTGDAKFDLYNGSFSAQTTLPAGDYVFAVGQTGGSTTDGWAWVLTALNVTCTGDPVSFSRNNGSGKIAPYLLIRGGTYDNLVFRPMLCKAADWAISHEFAPYCPTMPELYQMILDLQSGGASLQSASPNLMNALNEAE